MPTSGHQLAPLTTRPLVLPPRAGDITLITQPSPDITELVARTGRHQQRYEKGYRLVAGCVPFRYKRPSACNGETYENGDSLCNGRKEELEILMVTSQRGDGLVFPKGGWESDETVEEAACREALEEAGVRGTLKVNLGKYYFKSKRQQGDFSPEGLCRAYMFALVVTEELDSWPEKSARHREWFSVEKATEQCRHDWMRNALLKCVQLLRPSLSHSVVDVPHDPEDDGSMFYTTFIADQNM